MEIAIASAAFVAAAACAAVMGFAIQRGATCTVAAVDEVLTQRRGTRLIGMAEASLWVTGGLVVAVAAGALARLPSGHATSWHTVAGGALLGLGAFVNRACVFGAIARLGSGEWSYVASPVGFYAGCVTFARLAAPGDGTEPSSPIALASAPLAALVLAAAALRLALGWRATASLAKPSTALPSRLWTPHAATTVIGIAFAVMFVLVGAWAYTDALADLAGGVSRDLAARLALALALLGGAIAGGWTAGRFAHRPASGTGVVRCFAGGALMGAGSLLIPGSNDGLILVGMPLLRPYAWIAFATMCATIALAMLAARRFARWQWAGHAG